MSKRATFDSWGLSRRCRDADEMYATDSPSARLHTDPHYSDNYWNEARTIFGRKVPGLTYVYDDRVRQWDYAKHESAWATALAAETPRTARFFVAYLSAYLGERVDVPHIMAGVNLSNGYPYLVFGYRGLAAAAGEAKAEGRGG